MKNNPKQEAFETTGILNSEDALLLNTSVPFTKNSKVKVIIIPEEITEEDEWLEAGTTNPAFSDIFENDQDLYSLDDGKPFNG